MTIQHSIGKRVLIGLTVLGLGAGLGTTALAQQAHQPDSTKHQASHQAHEARMAKMHDKMAQHHAMLHDKLKLTAAQQPAWTAFGASMKSDVKPGERLGRMDKAALNKMTAPERLEKRIAMSKQHISRQETRLAALKTFYAALTPEQQKVFDDNVPGGEHGPKRGHHMR
jgi:Spy/CpxP family protein refolding chaperone